MVFFYRFSKKTKKHVQVLLSQTKQVTMNGGNPQQDQVAAIQQALDKLSKIGNETKKLRMVGSALKYNEMDMIVRAIMQHNDLKSVEICMCDIEPIAQTLFFSSLHFYSLVMLQLVKIGLTDELLGQLTEGLIKSAEVKMNTMSSRLEGERYTGCDIKKLDLTYNRDVTAKGVKALCDMYFSPFADFISLESLLIGRCNIGDEGCFHLARILKSTKARENIKWLDLRLNVITDVGLKHLSCGLQGSAVEMLQLGHNKFTREGLIEFCDMLKGTKIKILGLNHCGVDDEVAERLVHVIPYSKVTQLVLDNNEITDKGGFLLSVMVKNCPTFELIDLRNNKLTDATAKAILAAVNTHVSMKCISLGENQGIDEGAIEKIYSKLSVLHTERAKTLTTLCSVKFIHRIVYRSLLKMLPLDLIRFVDQMLYVDVSTMSLVDEEEEEEDDDEEEEEEE